MHGKNNFTHFALGSSNLICCSLQCATSSQGSLSATSKRLHDDVETPECYSLLACKTLAHSAGRPCCIKCGLFLTRSVREKHIFVTTCRQRCKQETRGWRCVSNRDSMEIHRATRCCKRAGPVRFTVLTQPFPRSHQKRDNDHVRPDIHGVPGNTLLYTSCTRPNTSFEDTGVHFGSGCVIFRRPEHSFKPSRPSATSAEEQCQPRPKNRRLWRGWVAHRSPQESDAALPSPPASNRRGASSSSASPPPSSLCLRERDPLPHSPCCPRRRKISWSEATADQLW